ncbi:MAG: sensor histidine kinase [Myxococcota bacterium]
MSQNPTNASLLTSFAQKPLNEMLGAVSADGQAVKALMGLAVAAEALATAGIQPEPLQDALGILALSQDFSTVGIWRHTGEPEGAYALHARWRASDEPVPTQLKAVDWGLEWLHNAIRDGEIIEVWYNQSPQSDRLLELFGDESLLLVPIEGISGYWGVAMFATRRGQRTPWSAEAKSCLRTFATIVGAAVRREQTRANLGRMRAALEASRREEGLATLAAGIAHDVGNMLAVLRAGMDLAVAKGQMDQTAAERIDRSVDTASAMVEQLYAFAGLEPRTRVPVDLRRLIDRGLRVLDPTRPEHTHVKLNFSDGLPPVLGNVTQVGQIIGNLVMNALEALEAKGGTITIGARAEDRSEPGVLLWVQDDGPGVPVEVQPTLFTALSSTKGARRGIGLASASGLVRSHGGTLRLVATKDPGSRFEVWLPAATSPEQA